MSASSSVADAAPLLLDIQTMIRLSEQFYDLAWGQDFGQVEASMLPIGKGVVLQVSPPNHAELLWTSHSLVRTALVLGKPVLDQIGADHLRRIRELLNR
jgi:hypothetical protein